MKRLRVKTLMVVVLFAAIDLASYHTMITDGSAWAVVVFLVMNVMMPMVAVMVGLFLAIRRIWRDHTSTTLY
ncbi:hypothetical protein V5E97_12075 [Singulisphaera sp. Ch08]|uniref:Uncharacterized protein n=1 Tax=Singulisphaera sp. Ch08 TaxID=3120278 RepID=A0AAU7CND4_9BACT